MEILLLLFFQLCIKYSHIDVIFLRQIASYQVYSTFQMKKTYITFSLYTQVRGRPIRDGRWRSDIPRKHKPRASGGRRAVHVSGHQQRRVRTTQSGSAGVRSACCAEYATCDGGVWVWPHCELPCGGISHRQYILGEGWDTLCVLCVISCTVIIIGQL